MARRKRNSHAKASGFTLIEVVLALVVLGGSLVVLLGLQSSLITRTLRDETQEQAILLTRRVLAPLEAGIASTDAVEITGSFSEVYNKIFPEGGGRLDDDAQAYPDFNVSYVISPWKVAGIDADVMRKVTVTVAWGEASVDRTTTNYFIPVQQ